MKKIRVFSFAIVILMLLLSIPIPIFSETVRPSDIAKTDIMDDLKVLEAYVGHEDEFLKNAELDYCDIIEFLEMGYSYDNNKKALYWIYVYNPSGKAIVTDSGENLISIMAGTTGESNPKPIRKYKLSFHSKSDDNVFYKFKVLGDNTFEAEVEKGVRHYTITDLEFQYEGTTDGVSVKCSGLWSYSGYDVNCGRGGTNQKSTLEWKSTNIVTLELDLNPASWKSVSSDKGYGYSYELHSVYFAVPDEIIKKYGDPDDAYKGLVQVDGTYENYKLSGISTTNDSFYTQAMNCGSVDCDVSSVDFGFKTAEHLHNNLLGKQYFDVMYGYNSKAFPLQMSYCQNYLYGIWVDKYLSTFGNVFRGESSGIKEESLRTQIKSLINDNRFVSSSGSYSENAFCVKTDKNVNLVDNMAFYASRGNLTGMIYGFFTGDKVLMGKEEYSSVEPLIAVNESYILTTKKEEISDTHFIQEEEVEKIVENLYFS